MEVIVTSIAGFLCGWGIYQLAYWIPIWAHKVVPTVSHSTQPALWQLLRTGQRTERFWFGILSELLSMLTLPLLVISFPPEQAALLIAAYLFFLLITLIDVLYRLILNLIIYPAIALSIILHLLLQPANFSAIIVGGMMVFALFFLTAWLRPGQLGGGDVKLATLLGFIFGFPQVLWALLIGAGTGAVVAIVMLATGRYTLKTSIPYAPFLCLGAMIALLYYPFGW